MLHILKILTVLRSKDSGVERKEERGILLFSNFFGRTGVD